MKIPSYSGKSKLKGTGQGRVPLQLPNSSLGKKAANDMGLDLKKLLPPGYDVESAEITSLNSDYNKYFVFNKRLINGAIPLWYSSVLKGLYAFIQENPNNTTSRRWITNVEVIIDKSGEIIEVQPYRLSGTWRFDEAPIKAFKTFGKAPNPPKEMLDENGLAHLRFGFSIHLVFSETAFNLL